MTSAQTALVGNGRLLITLDRGGDVLGASWPQPDAYTQVSRLHFLLNPAREPGTAPKQRFASPTLVRTTIGGVDLQDEVLADTDVWVRRVHGARSCLVAVVPALDGRMSDQTIYYDEGSQVLLAYHRRNWLAIGGTPGTVLAWQCSIGELPPQLSEARELTGERIASRVVHGLLRVGTRSDEGRELAVLVAFAATREAVLDNLERGRRHIANEPATNPSEEPINLPTQSRNVIRLLSNSVTGGVLAGPPLQVDIPSEPGYAAVWGRDAAWTLLGSLAAGDVDRVEAYLEFAFTVQSPEGLWLHRHHTDYSLGSSWGLHQLDETGINLHLLGCYLARTSNWTVAERHRSGIWSAADFMAATITPGGLPVPSVDLWEERESQSAYTAASYVGGLRAAAGIARKLGHEDDAHRWTTAAANVAAAVQARLWSEDHGRFIKAIRSRPALQLDDESRTDLPSKFDVGSEADGTPLASYPNWTTGPVQAVDLTIDASVLGLCVPFGVVAPDDSRMVSTVQQLQSRLWTEPVGGMRRYEGDTYGGGNPWPLVTLWTACYHAARGDTDSANRLLDWVKNHTGPNQFLAEQVHRVTGEPVAALPMAWAHGMVLLAEAAVKGDHVWSLGEDWS